MDASHSDASQVVSYSGLSCNALAPAVSNQVTVDEKTMRSETTRSRAESDLRLKLGVVHLGLSAGKASALEMPVVVYE